MKIHINIFHMPLSIKDFSFSNLYDDLKFIFNYLLNTGNQLVMTQDTDLDFDEPFK